jgi:hypothetical protein
VLLSALCVSALSFSSVRPPPPPRHPERSEPALFPSRSLPANASAHAAKDLSSSTTQSSNRKHAKPSTDAPSKTQKRVAGRSSRSNRQSRTSYFFFDLLFLAVIQSGWKFGFSQSNNPNKSPSAGLFTGTYALAALDFGSGKLSRLRLVIVGKLQFRSINFTSETWS